ncbi:MAG: hypothetical protein OZSIB_1674 [Candidatus Ozemobacter sibiricus]|uniref:Band 7 domain-containing protein n=1 Tax=Candidatus Ozemobacter sibiricus TaxID=2268124 RepID=A0A367ZJD7_9BACT|nr:MAG: hypothetical protein OZSIB_1674 [Candidatus Ozemobacter sibiricus]
MINRYLLAMAGVALLAIAIFFSAFYHTFFIYVPAERMLIIISKTGRDLPPGQIIATEPGQKGIQLAVYGEGRHFVLPYFYETRLEKIVTIPPRKVGVVTSLVGKEPPPGAVLVNTDEKGVWRKVLPPGKYRLNPYAYKIEIHPAVEINPGYVGCVTSLVGKPPKGRFAQPGEKGILQQILQPGLYYLNPLEYRVQEVEIGINQVSFTEANQIRFPSKDAFSIAIEATVEWELLPQHVAQVISEFGGKEAIEEKVIIPQSKSIGRIQGSSYGAKEFLLGTEREKFQTTFTQELEKVCEAKKITIHSAFIRQLSIPDNLLLPIREAFIAVEKEKTAKFWEETRKSASELERERALITQRRAEVKAETSAIVNTIAAQTEQEVGRIEAETQLEVAKKEQEIAAIEASKTVLLGEARATVTRLRGEARSKGLELKIRAFGDNPRAYANYMFARELPPNLQLRLIYSGPGTLWTDLGKTGGLDGLTRLRSLQREAGAATEAAAGGQEVPTGADGASGAAEGAAGAPAR